jgi:ribosomal protein S27AE
MRLPNGGNLREALLTYGPNLEWDIDTQNVLTARYTNGFEQCRRQIAARSQGCVAGQFLWQHGNRLECGGR